MRLMIALVAAVAAVAASQIAIAPAAAQGDAVVSVLVGQGEPAREWDIDVAGAV